VAVAVAVGSRWAVAVGVEVFSGVGVGVAVFFASGVAVFLAVWLPCPAVAAAQQHEREHHGRERHEPAISTPAPGPSVAGRVGGGGRAGRPGGGGVRSRPAIRRVERVGGGGRPWRAARRGRGQRLVEPLDELGGEAQRSSGSLAMPRSMTASTRPAGRG
jgi:hypothetical protein